MSMGFEIFNLFSVIFPIVFVAILGIILISILKRFLQWSKNNNSPIEEKNAQIVAKRMCKAIHINNHAHDGINSHQSTTIYYITFEIQTKERIELQVSGKQYGLLVEGDCGLLFLQGTRYKDFQIVRMQP